jgi:hypothetical protein
MFTLANQLVASYDCIGIGDYRPKNLGHTRKMRRASLAALYTENLKICLVGWEKHQGKQ